MKRRSEFQLHQHLADHLERHRTYNDEGTGRAIPRINRSFRYGVGLLLLLAGLSLAAQTPTQGSAELKHGQSYSTDADEITNTTVTWFHGWEFELGNHGGAQIQNPVIQMQTFLPMIGFPQNDPSYFTANPAQGIYIWNFTGYDLTAGAQFSVDAEDSSVVAPPGFSISRTVSPELLTGASTQQTVTVTLTIEQALPADVNALEIYFGSFPSIVNGTTLIDSQFVSQAPVAGWTAWAAGTTVVGWSIPPANVQVGQTYTFQAVLNNVKSPQLLGSPDSKPGVTFDFERTTVLPPVTANSVTIHHPTEPISFTAATGTLVNWQRLVSDSEVGVRIHPLQPMIEGTSPPFRVQVPATVRIEPSSLNMKSQGVITAFLQIPAPYSIANVNLSTVSCQGAPALSGVIAADQLVLKFSTQDLQGISPGSAVPLTIQGQLKDGSVFEASDPVRVR